MASKIPGIMFRIYNEKIRRKFNEMIEIKMKKENKSRSEIIEEIITRYVERNYKSVTKEEEKDTID